jgi:hypothetical protein
VATEKADRWSTWLNFIHEIDLEFHAVSEELEVMKGLTSFKSPSIYSTKKLKAGVLINSNLICNTSMATRIWRSVNKSSNCNIRGKKAGLN